MFQLSYVWLALAICAEVAGSAFLAKSEQFSRLVPSGLVVFFYGLAFYGLSQALKNMPLGIAYAIWAGLGIVLTAAVGVVVFKQKLDLPAVAGIVLIVVGVVVMNGFSKTASH
ncbi:MULTISPECIES: multidrug efflux SMR transporter [unclassified Massilia]|uniref:DMT family transporter n=1 Tax=unclassified Massilia TaxID=2609279 RepID=UPI00177A800B|nr:MULTISPECIES: multidrug efflux SMR transporter [unclassified Massilia]MBD8528895.1 multidrug efflux SMR transporter [Massilia sp. CFBP 13647]MBD8673537.1 multidrug efflux SMR transporter [Massilia sp. CFBP 13721]